MSAVTDILADLVAMPTITADSTANEAALDHIEAFLAARGMHCQRHRFEGRGALTASSRPDNMRHPVVLLSAHMDVVGGSAEQFTLQEQNGQLLGRGVYDMKFAVAGYMQIVDDLAQAKTLSSYDFGIMITTDEEAPKDSQSGVSFLVAAGYGAQVAILPDSTAPGWDIEKVSKGWWRLELIATGTSVHSSRPWEGESASLKLIHALHELKEQFTQQGPLTDTLNIGSIHGGDVYNQVPDHISAKVEIRLVHERSWPKAKARIEDLCRRHDLTYETFSLVQPVRPILNDPLVATYRQVVREITGREPQGYISLGGSDAPFFTDAGIPCIISCPLGGGHHGSREWIDRASFEQFVPILHRYLDATARGSGMNP